MKKSALRIFATLAVVLLCAMFFAGTVCLADEPETAAQVTEAEEQTESVASTKALAAAGCVAIVAAVGAVSMGLAISKASDGISRQPEADGKIRTTLMLGLVFIETAIIYSLVVAIMIIFLL